MDRFTYRNRNEIPSFSSTLLDVIYQSIDNREDEETVVYRNTMRNRHGIDSPFPCVGYNDNRILDSTFRRSGAGSKNIGDAVLRRKLATDYVSNSQRSEGNRGYYCSKYCSDVSSSEAEAEAERIYGFPERLRVRPLRTASIYEDEKLNTRETSRNTYDSKQMANCEGKTKSRATKIYNYLKKGKQPISPGGRFASFIMSLFSTPNAKKSKISSPCTGGHDDAVVFANRKSKSKSKSATNVSTSSSASSFSRSCLSPSSLKKNERFYPPNVNLIGGYSLPRGHKSRNGEKLNSPAIKFAGDSINREHKQQLTEKNFQIDETARNLLRNYQKKVEYVFDLPENDDTNIYDDDEAAASSDASSDLFELDHLSAIGVDRCMQELPLYETTSADANRAIANGLIV